MESKNSNDAEVNKMRWDLLGHNWLTNVTLQDAEQYLQENCNMGIFESINKVYYFRCGDYFEFSGWTQDDEYVGKTTLGQFGFASNCYYNPVSIGNVIVEYFDKLLDSTGIDREKLLKWIILVSQSNDGNINGEGLTYIENFCKQLIKFTTDFLKYHYSQEMIDRIVQHRVEKVKSLFDQLGGMGLIEDSSIYKQKLNDYIDEFNASEM